jgi:hypothetical protein
MAATVEQFCCPFSRKKNKQLDATIPATQTTQVAAATATMSAVKELLHPPYATTQLAGTKRISISYHKAQVRNNAGTLRVVISGKSQQDKNRNLSRLISNLSRLKIKNPVLVSPVIFPA